MEILSDYHVFKDAISADLGISHTMLHVHFGLAIYVVVQVLMGTRRASLTALAIVGAAELANETLDALFCSQVMVADTISDICATLAWPLILFGAGKIRRWQWRQTRARLSWRRGSLPGRARDRNRSGSGAHPGSRVRAKIPAQLRSIR